MNICIETTYIYIHIYACTRIDIRGDYTYIIYTTHTYVYASELRLNIYTYTLHVTTHIYIFTTQEPTNI